MTRCQRPCSGSLVILRKSRGDGGEAEEEEAAEEGEICPGRAPEKSKAPAEGDYEDKAFDPES